MAKIDFCDWLITEKGMSIRAARDVISRCKRIEKMLSIETIDMDTASMLIENDQFQASSMFIKSQLKRAVSLNNEYQERCE